MVTAGGTHKSRNRQNLIVRDGIDTCRTTRECPGARVSLLHKTPGDRSPQSYKSAKLKGSDPIGQEGIAEELARIR